VESYSSDLNYKMIFALPTCAHQGNGNVVFCLQNRGEVECVKTGHVRTEKRSFSTPSKMCLL